MNRAWCTDCEAEAVMWVWAPENDGWADLECLNCGKVYASRQRHAGYRESSPGFGWAAEAFVNRLTPLGNHGFQITKEGATT